MRDLAAIPVTKPDGSNADLSPYSGEVMLIVNVASQCGFTPQYEGLEALQRKYGDKGFTVLGFPCNQFGAQEPGDAEEIASFCKLNYDVSFPLYAKIDVNGDNAAPIYRHLKREAPGAAWIEVDQMELHQVPGRPVRQGGEALPAASQARRPRQRH
jgi:glutathione peroxidase